MKAQEKQRTVRHLIDSWNGVGRAQLGHVPS